MTVRVADNVIHLEDHCRVEEAEALLQALQEGAHTVDIGRLTRIHLAPVQILLAVGPAVRGIPSEPFLRDWLLPLFKPAD